MKKFFMISTFDIDSDVHFWWLYNTYVFTFIFIFVCMDIVCIVTVYACIYVGSICVHVCLYAHGQMSSLVMFLCYSLIYFFEMRSLTDPEITNSSGLAGYRAPVIHQSQPPQLQDGKGTTLRMGACAWPLRMQTPKCANHITDLAISLTLHFHGFVLFI